MTAITAPTAIDTKQKPIKKSLIAAVIHVSESEIALAYKDYCTGWEEDNPRHLRQVLWGFGLDTDKPYVRQDGLQHRNKLGKIVGGSRWYGNERSDAKWLSSGYASREAIDKAKNNPLLDDTYRARCMTTDAQETLESRDRQEK